MLYVHRDCIFHIFKQRWQNITHQYKFIQHFMLKQTNVKRELCGFQTMADKASDDGRLNTSTQEGKFWEITLTSLRVEGINMW